MRVKKSINGIPMVKQKNLEKKRGLFFQIGLIISLSIVLLAFEWTTVRTNVIDWDNFGGEVIDEELAIVTMHEKKKFVMPKPQIIRPIEVVTNEIETDEVLEITTEITNETINELNFVVEEEPDIVAEENQVFTVVEQQPQFPGGYAALQKFLKDKLEYPSQALDIGISGRVYVLFVVWKDGSIRDVRIKRGIGGGCDEEAMRIVKLMPKWNPGLQRTFPVNVELLLPVSFKLMN